MTPDSPVPDDFDAASTSAALAGTWRYNAPEDPSGVGYLHFTAKGYAFQFVHDPQRPGKPIPVRLSYVIESPFRLRLRPQGDPNGWTCNYQLAESTLTLLPPAHSFSCCRVPADEAPEWLRDALAAELSRP